MGVAPIKMPQLGESVTEGTVDKWLKKEGDFVKRDEPLVEVVTDKVNAEIPSPFEGKLVKISVSEGETGAETSCEQTKADSLTGRAQRASTVLRNACDPKQFFEAVKSALCHSDCDVPELTNALAAIAWPLVITTNYDDLYYGACRCSAAHGRGSQRFTTSPSGVSAKSPRPAGTALRPT